MAVAKRISKRKLAAKQPLLATSERGSPALYFQLADVFRRRILEGQWLVDNQIPTIEALMADFRTARSTVRQALQLLEQEGLLSRQRGRGTFILKRPERHNWQALDMNWLSLVSSTHGETRELLKSEPTKSPPVPSHPGGTLAPQYQYFVRRYLLKGCPYAIRSAYLDSRLWKNLTRTQVEKASMISTLMKLPDVTIDRCEQTITISSADFEIAGSLEVSLNTPIAVVERSVFNSENVLVFETCGYYRGDFVKMNATIK